jgi:hypothetical protein
MKYGRAVRTGRAGDWERALVLLAVLIALALPTRALALDSDLKGSATFRLEASNGYSILALAASERADGRGDILLIVSRGQAGVLYAAPATVTPTKLEADLGVLGRISLDVVSSGVERTLRPRCGGESVTVETDLYRGTFEFKGEEGYTEASAEKLSEYARFWVDFGCDGVSSGEVRGRRLPGARLRLNRGERRHRLDLQVNKNRPGARSRFEVEVHEKRGRIGIFRSAILWAGAAAFDYDPLLGTATLEPPAPFSGRATFHRGAVAANRWKGNLSVDLPGRSGVPLTGIGARATLVPSCFHEGPGRFRC